MTSRVWGALAILAALALAAWAVMDAKDGGAYVTGAPGDDTELAALKAENAWLMDEVKRLREQQTLTAPATPDGPELAISADVTPPSADDVRQWLRWATGAQKVKHTDLRRVKQTGHYAVAQLLVAARNDNETDAVRIASLKVLQRVDATQFNAVLVELLRREQTSSELIAYALPFVKVPRDSEVPAIVRDLALDRQNTPVKTSAMRVLMRAQPEEAVTEIRRMLASGAERSAAMGLLRAANDATFKPVVDEAIRDAKNPGEIRPLLGVLASFKGKNWGTYQMTGEPDTPIGGDLGTAWASKQGNMGDVWVELDYRYSVVPSDVRIHETYNAGAVKQVLAKQPGGQWTVLWEGTAPQGKAPRWFEPRIDMPRFRTSTIRIVLDTNRVGGWNEIDAVELIGDGSRQWAVKARASSSYAGE